MITPIMIAIAQFVLTLGLLPVCVALAHRHDMTDKPDDGLKGHTEDTPHIGGLIIILSAAISMVILGVTGRFELTTQRVLEISAIVIIFGVGVIDDSRHLPIAVRLITQATAAIILVSAGALFAPFSIKGINILITVLGIITCINALNLLDIMDGLTGGISLLILGSLVFSLWYNNAASFYIYLAVCVMIPIIPFLIFNFRKNPKKIFLGDGGSTTLGIIIAILFIASTSTVRNDTAIGSNLVFISVPLFEIFFVSTMRILKKKNPMHGSNDHFPLRLQTMLKSKIKVAIATYIFVIITIAIGITLLYVNTSLRVVLTAILGVIYVGLWWKLASVEVN